MLRLLFILSLFIHPSVLMAQLSTVTSTWKNAEGEMKFTLPKSENSEVQKKLIERIKTLADDFFDGKVYLPDQQDDPKFQGFCERFYAAAKENEWDPDYLYHNLIEYFIDTKILSMKSRFTSLKIELEYYIRGNPRPRNGGTFITVDPHTGTFIEALSILKPEVQEWVVRKIQIDLAKDDFFQFPMWLPTVEEFKTELKDNFGIAEDKVVFKAWKGLFGGPESVGQFWFEMPFEPHDLKPEYRDPISS